MLTLSLLRHAKSSWDDPGLADFDRPLAPRGQKAAPLMGRWMKANAVVPDLVLASPSARTRETCELAFKALGANIDIRFDERIYEATPRTLLAVVREAPAGARHLMLVGHNPGLHALATALVDAGPRHLRSALEEKLPTAGLVVVTAEAPSFAALKPGTATLRHFVTPRSLAG